MAVPMTRALSTTSIVTTATHDNQAVYKSSETKFHKISSALTLLVGRQEGRPACKKTEWWGAGVVICLERGADLHMARLMPLPLTVSCFSKIQICLPFWYRLTRVVPDKWPLNRCVCVCVCVCSRRYPGYLFKNSRRFLRDEPYNNQNAGEVCNVYK